MSKKIGFTIVEVSLVLGIAGLIFMMVFIALPTLQRNQRDAQRREDMIILEDAIKNYQKNNRGALPTIKDALVSGDTAKSGGYADGQYTKTWAGLYRDYLRDTFKDPSGQNYNLNITTCIKDSNGFCSQTVTVQPTVLVLLQASCNGEKPEWVSNPRRLAILYKLEGGGIYCGSF